jgi:hypothetical protein
MIRRIGPILTVSVLAVALSGCFQNPIEAALEKAVESEIEKSLGESGVEVDLGLDGQGVSLPSGWPSSIPVPEGKIVQASKVGDTYTIAIEVASEAVGIAGAETLISQGFEVVLEQSFEGLRSWGLQNQEYSVTYQVMSDGEYHSVSMFVGPPYE